MSSLKLTSFTPLNSETKKKVITIWKTIYDSNDSLQFRNPVDWKAMGLLDYLKYVKKPMDLNIISRKLREQKYRTVENVLDDIQLIFDNCKCYNAPGSWIYNLSDKLEKSFIKMIRNFIPKIIESNPKSKINLQHLKSKQAEQIEEPMEEQPPFFIEEVSYNDKIKFTDKLSHINTQNLQLIVQKILDKNPKAVKIIPPEQASKILPESHQQQEQIQDQRQGQKLQQMQRQKIEEKQDEIQNQRHQQIQQQEQLQAKEVDSQVQNTIQDQNIQKPQHIQSQENMQKQVYHQNPQQFLGSKSLQLLGSKSQQKLASPQKNISSPIEISPIEISQIKISSQINEKTLEQQKMPDSKMQVEQANSWRLRGRRTRTTRNSKNEIKQAKTPQAQKISIDKMEIGTKAQIFIDDLGVESFDELMKMLQGMVEQKDKVMKKIKLD